MWALLELVADFLSAIFMNWRSLKWKHDPPLKGDPPRESEAGIARITPLKLLFLLIGAMLLYWFYWATIGNPLP